MVQAVRSFGEGLGVIQLAFLVVRYNYRGENRPGK